MPAIAEMIVGMARSYSRNDDQGQISDFHNKKISDDFINFNLTGKKERQL